MRRRRSSGQSYSRPGRWLHTVDLDGRGLVVSSNRSRLGAGAGTLTAFHQEREDATKAEDVAQPEQRAENDCGRVVSARCSHDPVSAAIDGAAGTIDRQTYSALSNGSCTRATGEVAPYQHVRCHRTKVLARAQEHDPARSMGREYSPWVRGPCVHASASHTCLHWEFPAIQRRRRPSRPDVHPNPNRLTGTKMAPLVARVSRSPRGRGPAVQPGTLSCVALVERDSLSKDVIVSFACLVRWGNSPDRRGQSIFRLGHTAVVLHEPHVCPSAASAFPLPFARFGDGSLSWHTVASPKRVAAHTHDHAHENTKKREAGLPFVETVVILEDEGEGL